ncbi:hypothetical protein N7453_002867 [Penicillium expansum]|nr:hypothetical protein N7453_002867 [Penicillium expansum]
MPRQQRRAAPTPARSAPSRPTAAPARPAAAPSQQQSQPHSTAAQPPTGTAGSSHAAAECWPWTVRPDGLDRSSQAMDNGLYQSNAAQTSYENPACEVDVRNFRTCMDENQGNLGICGWYLDQLKACQAAAKPY